VVRKSGLARPIDDRLRVERLLKHSNLIVTARQAGRLVGFARSLTDFCFSCYPLRRPRRQPGFAKAKASASN